MVETAKFTFYFETDKDPKASALLQRKDGTIERLTGDSDYNLVMELLKRLDTNRLSSSNEYSDEVTIPALCLSKEDGTSYVTDKQIDALFE